MGGSVKLMVQDYIATSEARRAFIEKRKPVFKRR